MPQPLIDPRLRRGLENQWHSICCIQTLDVGMEDSGQALPTGSGTPVSGMERIQCRLGPVIIARVTDDEVRSPSITETFARRVLKLNGYFPMILPHSMQAVVDGVTYPIRGVESDSEQFCTRLRLEEINP